MTSPKPVYVPPFRKRILKRPFVLWLASAIIAGFIRFVFYTSRKSLEAHADATPYIHGEKNAIFCFWHGRMMLMPMLPPKTRKMNVMISRHNDGEIISRAMERFGFSMVRGSSRRGGHGALTGGAKVLAQGESLGITPDGPKGPFQVAQQGAVYLASTSGVPLIPVTFSARWHIRFRSWDRAMLALPFSRVCFIVGAPIAVPANADDATLEHFRKMLEEAMNTLVDTADRTI